MHGCQVYFQLEGLSKADPPYKSVAALNCVILGSANIWDLERSYETFESIEKAFGLVPDVHSYNALISAFGKHRKVCFFLYPTCVLVNDFCRAILTSIYLFSRQTKLQRFSII